MYVLARHAHLKSSLVKWQTFQVYLQLERVQVPIPWECVELLDNSTLVQHARVHLAFITNIIMTGCNIT